MRGENRRLRQETRALRWVQLDQIARCEVRRRYDTIQLEKRPLDERIARRKKRAQEAVAAPNHIVAEACRFIDHGLYEFRTKARKLLLGFAHALHVPNAEPLQVEVRDGVGGPRIVEHATHLALEYANVIQRAALGLL